MGVNKVEFGDETLIDLTEDTVNASSLVGGYTAHSADGEPITGEFDDYVSTTSDEEAYGIVIENPYGVLNAKVNQNTSDIATLNNNLVDVTSGDISTSHTLSEVSYCKKKCGIVNVTINLTTTSQVARYSAVAKIPDGFRPTGYVYLYCGDAKYAIQPNGNVQTLGTIASGTEIVMSTTYICA